MKKLNIFYFCLLISLMVLSACSQSGNVKRRTDTPTSGVARIVVDECLAPIIQQQIDVFQGTYPAATIVLIYTNEKEAYQILEDDSVRVIIGTRKLSASEEQKVDKRRQRLLQQRLAIDGVALIVNKNNNDTLITVENVKKIMTGEIRSWKQLDENSKLGDITVVFDSPNSSTARFISDSIIHRQPFGEHVRSMSSDTVRSESIKIMTPNQMVVDYVQQNKGALGVVGVNWVSNPADSTGLSFSPKVNVMSVGTGEVVDGKASHYKPFPAFLKMGVYPLNRNVYIIITDSRGGLPSGFVSFAAGEIGQRIIFKSGLFPATIPTRVVSVKPMSEL